MPRTPRVPAPPPTLPVLSPPFISADDAARWAYGQADYAAADKELGGAILKQGHYWFATTPVADQHVTFDHRIVLATDAEDSFIAPEGYTCEALYHSHPPDMAQVKRHNPGMSDEQASVFISFFSPADLRFIIEHRRSVVAHYVFGPEGSLLKYASSGSAAEVLLRKRIAGEESFAPSADFESLIWLAAQAGDLRVVVANAHWGGVRGRVKHGWRINAAVTQVTEEQPFCTSVFERADLALMAARALFPEGSAQGFVLKHTRGEAYVATYPEALGTPLFSPAARFPLRADGQLRLPSNFRLEAIYYRATPLAADIPAREPWLYSTFFTPAEVAAAITQSRATLALQDKARGLQLYLQASDGALLKLQVPGAETDLAGADVDDNGAQAALLAGTLSPRGYVRRVIASTTVSVVATGLLWRTVGPVDDRSAVLDGVSRAVISRAFISAHDAAVYAHEQIGRRRERAYGGYVLEDAKGHFFITAPEASDANPFAQLLFFPADGQGPLIPPEPYQVVARYGSHPALSMVDPEWVAQRRWSREDALINLQVFSADEIHAVISHRQPAYLSAAEDCLLAYTPSFSSAEQRLLSQTAPQPGGSAAQQRLDSGQVKPAQWVIVLAEAGDLRVILGNALWGPRSPVYDDWTAYFDYAPRVGAPDYATYGALFASADAAARNLHARVHGRNLAEQAYFGFILKHKDTEQYLASEVAGAGDQNALFKLNRVFAPIAGGDFRFPDGFVLCGLFRSQQWQPAGLPAPTAWLTRYFVMPKVLYVALYDTKRAGEKYSHGKNLPVYFSTEEGALLRYVSLPFNVGSGGPVDRVLEEDERLLISGQKTAQAFVRDWADRGELKVIHTSQCWDTPGVVSRTWAGYEHLARRRLSPAFASADDAARYAADIIGEGRRRAYGGVLLRQADGLYVATDPLALPPQGFALNWVYPDVAVTGGLYPHGSTVVARYRSVLGEETQMLLAAEQKAIYQSMLPTAVLSNLLHRDPRIQREYLFGPHGTILRYPLTGSVEEAALKARLVPLNPLNGNQVDTEVERQLRAGTLLPGDFVGQVAKAGDLRVIKGNALWGFARRVSAPFVANLATLPALEIKQVFADAPCSPIFARADDAVRYAQRLASPRPEVQFGYVLKSLNKNAYMTTLPLVRGDYTRLAQVFADGLLPQGYGLDGLYLCASTAAIAPPSDAMATSFFTPQALAGGVGFVSNLSKSRGLPLYLLCADGALLSYVVDKNGRQLAYAMLSQAGAIARRMLEGSSTVASFVRELAAKGALEVRVRSTVWGKEQAVTAQWQPNAEPWPFEHNPHVLSFCGPLFSHADDAARWARKQVGPFKGVEYLGAVLTCPGITGFVPLDPIEDRHAWLQDTIVKLFRFERAGLEVTVAHPLFGYAVNAVQAFYKGMAAVPNLQAQEWKLLNNFVSGNELRSYLDIVKINRPVAESVYLTCRGGALLKYVPGFTAAETQLLSAGASVLPSALVSGLWAAGQLAVLETDAFWTHAGVLGTAWQANLQAEPDPLDVQYGRDKDEL
ncbi:hypothetical protein HKK58_22585 [Pseudomonas sp. ADAK22]|uniref:DUF4329 domain-containing protein n=1 Tax=Pseudomonas sp. ADAK22 TaxID=2730851 RepID=UPI0014628888|nr:DUF4329 domain-containing protein [Pseudomonas sp. ADAK22]QJI15222.1 hypothetical protein HKK58_22585 [Pseudomonas sp. ADAK22]